jgi:hypothetical protein
MRQMCLIITAIFMSSARAGASLERVAQCDVGGETDRRDSLFHADVTSSVATPPHHRISFPAPGGERRPLVNPSEKFKRFAAECEAMSNFVKSAESKATWKGMATRWTLFAQLVEDRYSPQVNRTTRRRRRRYYL